jgi:hypothetical protein
MLRKSVRLGVVSDSVYNHVISSRCNDASSQRAQAVEVYGKTYVCGSSGHY